MPSKRCTKKLPQISLLIICLMVFSLFSVLNVPKTAAQEAATFKILNPLTGDSAFLFDSAAYPINSTFRMDFYITEIPGLVSWQFLISFDSRVINITDPSDVWLPQGNVFADYDPINVPPTVEFELNKTGTLKYGAFIMDLSGVDVAGLGLLCSANFTISGSPGEGETISTNLNLIRQLYPPPPENPDTFVITAPIYPVVKRPVFMEPVHVAIGAAITPVHDICLRSVTVDKGVVEEGDNVTITVSFSNIGNVNEAFNLTLSYDTVELAKRRQVMNPNVTDSYYYHWNTTGLAPSTWSISSKRYTISAVIDPVPDEANITNNQATVTIDVQERATTFKYAIWLVSMWFSTPLGTLLIIYVIIVVGFFSSLAVMRRLKR